MTNRAITIVTTPDLPGGRFPSEYGNLTYREWCWREMARMNQKGDDVFIDEYAGRIALARRRK